MASNSITITPNNCNCELENLLKNGFGSKCYSDKKIILSNGRPVPILANLCSEKKTFVRKFSVDLYKKHEWLTGCEYLNKLFCWPCVLFDNSSVVWRTNGFCDLNNLHKAIKRHESAADHLKSVLAMVKFGSVRIETSLSQAFAINIEKHNALVKQNMNVLECLIDVSCYLVEQDMPFRGHDESATSVNKGKFVELVYLLSKHNPHLKNQIENSTVFTGLSNHIQDDLIQCLSSVLRDSIKHEINNASFVSLIMDETVDVANKSQLSIVFRYIDKKGEVQERFLGFLNVSSDKTALNLFEIVKSVLHEFSCYGKLVAQSYDGAAVMAGHINGLQTRVRSICKEALFVHCYAHKLNLVLSQSVSHIKACHLFFITLSGISTFFRKSSKRSNALDQLIQKRMPASAPTRWQYSARIVYMVFEYRIQLVELFNQMLSNPNEWDTESLNSVRGFQTCLLEFKFNFLLVIFSEIFPLSDVLFDCLQKKNSDISLCNKKVTEYAEIIQKKREDFENVWMKSNLIVDFNNYKRTRSRNEIDGATDLLTPYRKLFFEIIDNIGSELNTRFQNIEELGFLEILNCSFFPKFKREFPETQFLKLKTQYERFFDFPKLRSELNVIYQDSDLSTKDVLHLNIYIVENDLGSTFTEVAKLVALFLTIPATSVSSERSFSALRRIKTYLRSTLSDTKLSAMAQLSIEKLFLKKLKSTPEFYDLVINEFKKKDRRIELTYK